MINGIIAVVVAYLLGSIPSAYIVTRLKNGKDIRRLGGGNVGANNVYREFGLWPAVAVGVFDVAKGAGAVAIAAMVLDAPVWFILAAGLAVVAGHMWSVYLKFTGGNGLATTIGVLSVVMSKELLIVIAITIAFIVFTRNPILSTNISLLSVPVAGWFIHGHDWTYVIFPVLIIIIMVVNFLPTARAALARAGSKENLTAELMRHEKTEDRES